MKIVKRLDTYLLGAFLQLLAGTFFVCLFVFMMQFTWRYTDELIGKGLGVDVLAKFFWYMALTLVPMSLPLAVLLASLITFGNMGEQLELLSMKAAGIQLYRILAPLAVAVTLLCGASFVFQNRIAPEATKKLAALLWSMRKKSPELEIPEGEFYSNIPGYNIFVEHKDKETGLLRGVMIYTTTTNFEDIQIVLADSARLQSTADKKHLQLTLFKGERFRNMDAQSGNRMRVSVPYMRETFEREVDLIEFDTDFDLMSSDLFGHNAQAKGLREITTGIDSLHNRIDSVGRALYASLRRGPMSHKDARRAVSQMVAELDFRAMMSDEDVSALARHQVEWHKKWTLSLACLTFFFIGAPLGAIIRKGGLGVPVIVSVLFFIFYYIINVSGEKMAKSGQWAPTFGAWLSTIVLAPLGVWLTVKSNKDSVVFNIDGYKLFFQNVKLKLQRYGLQTKHDRRGSE